MKMEKGSKNGGMMIGNEKKKKKKEMERTKKKKEGGVYCFFEGMCGGGFRRNGKRGLNRGGFGS